LYSAKMPYAGSSLPLLMASSRPVFSGANFATSAAVKNILLPSSASR